MKALKRIRSLEILSGIAEGSYDIEYAYDEQQRIIKETLTGAISRVTDYTYDAEDNISTEVISEDGRFVTKTYTYDPVTNNITKVQVSVS